MIRASGQTPNGAAVQSMAAIIMAACAVATAVWLLPASVHIVNWPDRAHRVAVFAPQYWFTRFAAIALVVAGTAVAIARRRAGGVDRLAAALAPLNVFWLWTVPYLPWLGDRFPLVLVLAGPVRWIFAALALTGSAARVAETVHISWLTRRPGRRTVFALSLSLYLALGLRSLAGVGLGGDEPHYLVITHSLLTDRDLQIENNHARRDYQAFFKGPLRPDYLRRGQNGAIYSIHAPGLSALLLPGYALAGAKGAVATAAILAALAGTAVFMVAARLTSMRVAWLVWTAVCLTVPFVPHAWSLYPEIAGLAIVAWAVWWWVAPEEARTGPWIGRGLCLALLPWLHTKFSVLLAGLALSLAWRLRRRWREAIALLLPIALSGIAWLGFFYVVYGSLDPQAPYGAYTAQFVRLSNVPRSLLGLLFDQKFGLLVYAPIYAFVVVGLWAGRRNPLVLGPGAVALAFALSSAQLYMWWGGSSAPARYLVPALPLVAPALTLGIARANGQWWAVGLAVSAALSLVIAGAGVIGLREFLLFSAPHGLARLALLIQGSTPLASALPTFTEEDWLQPLRSLLPWLGAGAFAVATARLCSRGSSSIWSASGALAAFVLGAAVLAPSFRADVRAESSSRGSLGLLQAFDPIGTRAFDYAELARLSPAAWLSRATIRFDRQPGSDVDGQGRMTTPLALPPGRYEVRVWFDGARARRGGVEAIVLDGQALARVTEPLTNPTVLDLDLPVAAPALWVRVTDPEEAQGVRRVEIVARVVSFESPPARTAARVIEPLPDRPGAYLAYLDYNTFPEHGVFWTRDTARGSVVVVPAGSEALEVVLHVGPADTRVSLWVGDGLHDLRLHAEETRTIRVAVPAGTTSIPISVQADISFVPARVDLNSTDTRRLGCQVRIGLR